MTIERGRGTTASTTRGDAISSRGSSQARRRRLVGELSVRSEGRCSEAADGRRGASSALVTLNINGQDGPWTCCHRTTLAMGAALQGRAHRARSWDVDRAECGACTVPGGRRAAGIRGSVLAQLGGRQEDQSRSRGSRRPMGHCIRCSRASWRSRDSTVRSACRAS